MFKKRKYISKIKSAFTLIEIMMVIVIIGILMGATMKFGGDRIGFLGDKNIKEQFISNYDSLYSDNMMTNYYLGNLYTILNITFDIGSDTFNYAYVGYDDILLNSGSDSITNIDGGKYKIIGLSIGGEDKKELEISFEPYSLGCYINGVSGVIAKINLLVNESKKFCFKIPSDTCRISSESCD